MSRLNINNLTNENEDGSPKISGISTFSSTHYFVPPSGTTAERPSHADPGMIRFNTDSGHLEYYNGVEWTSVIVNNNELGGGTGSNTGVGARGFVAGGAYSTNVNLIDYFTISVLGNSQDFGDLTTSRSLNQGCSSITRGIIFGGQSSGNVIDYVTISSTGDAQDFGDMQNTSGFSAALSNQTRGICNGSGASLDYITISSTGNAIDFGSTSGIANNQFSGGIASPVRGLFSGGAPASNTIQYVTISTTGDGQEFGDLVTASHAHSGCSNSIRGVYGGSDEATTQIIFVTIATTGNAQDFGDLSVGGRNIGASSSSTRGVFAGRGLSASNAIEYITIASTGNAIDFGDISSARGGAGFSNGHGGL
jgi:hypothetical protein